MGAEGHDSRHLLRQLMDNIGDNIFFKDREHNFIMINQANADWFQLQDPADAIGKSDYDFFDADYAKRELEGEKRIMETGEPLSGHVESTNYGGSLAWGSVTKIPMRDEHGEICGIMGIGRDITALKQQEIQLQQAHQEMAEDLRVAASLQKTFLPSEYPVLDGATGQRRIEFHHHYEASSQLGGDFCSIQQLSDSKVGLLICDVMGHGVRSALVTAGIRTIVDALIKKSLTAADFMTEMNQRVFPLMRSGENLIFATACYVIVDVATQTIDLALAGHPPPVRVQSEPRRVEALSLPADVSGPALALDASVIYKSFQTKLQGGDCLMLYTDGITEAADAEEEEFGLQNVLKLLRESSSCDIQEVIRVVVESAKAFGVGGEFADDVCLLGFTLGD